MDYKTLTDEQLQTERQNIMDEIARRNDLADIPKQAEEMALRFEKLGGSKSDLAQIVNDATTTVQDDVDNTTNVGGTITGIANNVT